MKIIKYLSFVLLAFVTASAHARFLSIDPVGFKEGNPTSFNRYAYANNNPYKYVDPDGREAIVIVKPIETGGFSFTASGDHYTGTITGTFNTATTNVNQLESGEYSINPRPALPDSIINTLLDRNKNAGNPTISNTDDWNTVRKSDGSETKGAQIHPGRNGTNKGVSRACLVTDKETFGKLNELFIANYNDGGVKLNILPASK